MEKEGGVEFSGFKNRNLRTTFKKANCKSKGAIILKQISSHGFLCDVFNIHRIPYDYHFIDFMGLNFLTINFQ